MTEYKHFWISAYVCRIQWIYTNIFCAQITVNHVRHLLCAEHRQFSPSCCVWRTQTFLTVILFAQNTDNSHRHVVCAEHRQFSPSCCVWRTQTEHRQFSLSFCACRTQTNRTQTILTVILCVQNTVGRWRGHVHQRCRRLRVVTVAPAQSAVPAQSVTLLPIGQSVLTHHVFSGTRMDRRWHSEGQQTRRQQQTEVSVHSFYCLHRLWAVLSVLPSSFLSSLFSLSCLLLCSLCLAFFLPVFLYSLSCLLLLCLLCSLCLVFFLPVSLFSLSCLSSCCLLCSRYLAFFLPMSVLAVLLSSFVSSFFSVPSCSVLKRNKLIGTVL